MESALGTIAELVEAARQKGAKGCEVLLSRTHGSEVSMHRGKPVLRASKPTESLTVRCWVEGGGSGARTGSAPEAMQLVSGALEVACAAPEDPHSGPVGRQASVIAGLGIDDRRFAGIEDADRIDVVKNAEASVRAVDRRLAPLDFCYADQRRQRVFANSKGVRLEEYDTTYRVSGTVSAKYDEGVLRVAEHCESRSFASVASIPFGTNLARWVEQLLMPAVEVSGPVRVMFAPRATAVFVAKLGALFEVRRFVDKSFFMASKEVTCHRRIHIIDNGTLPGALRSRSFDDRGVAPVSLTLLREGRPDGRFVDPRSARVHAVSPTGHVVEGQAMQPTNLALRSGTRSMNALQSERGGEVLQIYSLPDDLQLDTATGAFRAVVSGLVFRENKVVGSVRNKVLSGHLAEVFGKVVDVASNTDRIGHVDAPGILVDGCTLQA